MDPIAAAWYGLLAAQRRMRACADAPLLAPPVDRDRAAQPRPQSRLRTAAAP